MGILFFNYIGHWGGGYKVKLWTRIRNPSLIYLLSLTGKATNAAASTKLDL